MRTLEILDPTGHTELKWDPQDPSDVANARATVESLRDRGFSFFLTDDTTLADEVTAGAGQLIVRRVTSEELLAQESTPAPIPPASPEAEDVSEPETAVARTAEEAPRRRGRRSSAQIEADRAAAASTGEASTPSSNPGPESRAVAVRPMAGG